MSHIYLKEHWLHTAGGRSTFMTQKRTRTTKTLTCGWSHADERPRPGGGGYPEILVQVKLSNRELMHSLGISCQRRQTHVNSLMWLFLNSAAVCTSCPSVRPGAGNYIRLFNHYIVGLKMDSFKNYDNVLIFSQVPVKTCKLPRFPIMQLSPKFRQGFTCVLLVD